MPTKLISGTPNVLDQESVVESEGDSELNAWDVAVYARTAGTIKLSKNPQANREHLLAASGGQINVDGNGRGILGPTVVLLGQAIRYAFSEDQQKWIAECCGEQGPSGPPGPSGPSGASGPPGPSGPSGGSAILVWGDDNVTNTTTTRYLTPGYSINDVAPATPVGGAYLEMPRAGTIRKFRVRHNDPGTSTNVITYTLFVNGVATALTVTLAANAVDAADLVNSVVVAAGDRVSIEVTKPANITGGTNARMIVATAEVAA